MVLPNVAPIGLELNALQLVPLTLLVPTSDKLEPWQTVVSFPAFGFGLIVTAVEGCV